MKCMGKRKKKIEGMGDFLDISILCLVLGSLPHSLDYHVSYGSHHGLVTYINVLWL